MSEESVEYDEQIPVEYKIDVLNRTELNQAFADHLSTLIVRRSSIAENQNSITQEENTIEDGKCGRYIVRAIVIVAAGEGIYLEAIGRFWAGTTILVLDGLVSFNPVYSSMMTYFDQRRARKKVSYKI